jgi:SAM-dependent methyltransferase
LLRLYLDRELQLNSRSAVMLHIAPEECLMASFRRLPDLSYIPGDLVPPPDGVTLDVTDLALDSQSVDFIICSHVLEHVQEDVKALREFKRVLRPDGRALIMVPVDYGRAETYEDPSIVSPSGRLVAFNQEDHVRVYGADFDSRVRTAGFQLDANRYAQALDRRMVQRHGLNVDEVIYVCT